MATNINITCSYDNTTSSDKPDYSYPSDSFNAAGFDGNGVYTGRNFCYAWSFFSLLGIPVGSTINSAFLHVQYFFPITAYGAFDIVVTRAPAGWDPSITFNTQPAPTADAVSHTVDELSGNAFLVSHVVTSHVQNALADRAVSWRVHTADSFEGQTSGISLGAIEYGNGYPWLQVVYTEAGTGRRRSIAMSVE